MSAVVADSSPLNYLALLSDFDILHELYGSLVIPPSVHYEVVTRGSAYPVAAAVQAALSGWISVAKEPNRAKVLALRRDFRLDAGESEAIVVAESLNRATLLMDERRGVSCGRSRGLAVIRTPMIYADAKLLGLIPSVREKLDALRECGFRLSDLHYDLILKEVGE